MGRESESNRTWSADSSPCPWHLERCTSQFFMVPWVFAPPLAVSTYDKTLPVDLCASFWITIQMMSAK